jgi:hypothetical protein
MATKKCSKCGEDKPISEYYLKNGKPNNPCKGCVREQAAQWAKDNPEKNKASKQKYEKANKEKIAKYQRAWRLKTTYGITSDDFERLSGEQYGLCAICMNPPTERGLCVDHCHDTGEVRGLLCDSCNLGIGLLKDDAVLCENAMTYLERTNGH